MRTFEEIKETEKYTCIRTMQKAMQELEKGGLKKFEEEANKQVIQNCQSKIENIDEVTTIEIGAVTNSLIESMQTAYSYHLTDYWSDFEKFIDKYVLGLTPDGKLKDGPYFAKSQCYDLGVGINELLCFKGKDPMSGKTGDLFRQIINTNYGTNIPMSGIEEQALQDYNAVAFGDDEIAKAKAFVHLREIQRDSGSLRNGLGNYHLLANDQAYQDAKAICAGKTL